MRLAGLSLLLVWMAVSPCFGFAPYFRARGRAIVDGYGRERIFHGVNVVVKAGLHIAFAPRQL